MAGNQTRFFLDSDKRIHNEWRVADKALARQLRQVLRRRVGDTATIFDGTGVDFQCKIAELGAENLVFKIEKETAIAAPPVQIHLFWAPPKLPAKSELVCAKATEIGAWSLTPLQTQFSEKSHWRAERLQKIIVEAAEQCGRATLPKLHEFLELETALQNAPGQKIFCHGGANAEPLSQILTSQNLPAEISVFVGPEGGWSATELELAQASGCRLAQLTPHILRAESAAIAVCAFCMILACQKS